MNYSNINISDISIEDPIYNKKNSYFKSNLKDKIKFLTDPIKFVSKSEHNDKKIRLEFLNNYPKFYEFIYKVDEHIFKKIFQNAERWFGKTPKFDTINRLFERSISIPSGLNRNPTINLKTDDILTVHDINGEVINLDGLETNNEIVCRIRIDGIVFLENKFYIDTFIESIEIKNYVCQQTEYLFSE